MPKLNREEYYSRIQELANKHGENVSDKESWLEEYDFAVRSSLEPVTPEELFYEQYPEHQPPKIEVATPEWVALKSSIDACVSICHAQSKGNGWWNDLETGEPLERNVPEMLCLVHSEVSEGLEGYRKNLKDDHLPQHDMLTVELADAIFRICDMAGGLNLPLGQAIADKFEYNATRADHKPENRKAKGGKKI